MKTTLVIDVHYLCHRAFHTMRDLSWKGRATGVVYGFLKTLDRLRSEFGSGSVAFCFEGRTLLRSKLFPAYKQNRKDRYDPTEAKAYSELQIQIDALRKTWLPKMGFQNVFQFDGFESDDVMAALARDLPDDVVLVTADSDLYQCLCKSVTIYHPQKQRVLTQLWFEHEYGIPVRHWAVVKAMAGCSSDGIKGIKGVGEKTALAFLRGELKGSSAAYAKIVSDEGKTTVIRNKRLVLLPFDECPSPQVSPDRFSLKAWREVCAQLGMRSLA